MEVEEAKWFKLTKEQREAHLQKVAVQRLLTSKSRPMLAEEILMPLPIDAETFATSVKFPVPVLKGIFCILFVFLKFAMVCIEQAG